MRKKYYSKDDHPAFGAGQRQYPSGRGGNSGTEREKSWRSFLHLSLRLYTKMQMIFQIPQDSFDPRCTLGDGIMESMRNHGMKRKDARKRMYELLELAELDKSFASRYPHEVSGGQCQRAAIARALAVDPRILICDEATSALDVTIQAQIMDLLSRLQRDRGLSILLICHDLALVQKLCQRVLVMYKGSIIETGMTDEVIRHPREEYTKILIDSVF